MSEIATGLYLREDLVTLTAHNDNDGEYDTTKLLPVDMIAILGTRLQMPGVPADHLHGDPRGMLAGNWRVLGSVARHMLELEIHGGAIDYEPTPVMFIGGRTDPIDGAYNTKIPTEAAAYKRLFESTVAQVAQLDDTFAAANSQFGRPACLLEETAMTTKTSMQTTIERAADLGLHSLEFITNLYHEPRSLLMAHDAVRELGLESVIDVTVHDAESYITAVFGRSFDKHFQKAYLSPLGLRRLYFEAIGIGSYLLDDYDSAGVTELFESHTRLAARRDGTANILYYVLTRDIARKALSRGEARDPDFYNRMITMLKDDRGV